MRCRIKVDMNLSLQRSQGTKFTDESTASAFCKSDNTRDVQATSFWTFCKKRQPRRNSWLIQHSGRSDVFKYFGARIMSQIQRRRPSCGMKRMLDVEDRLGRNRGMSAETGVFGKCVSRRTLCYAVYDVSYCHKKRGRRHSCNSRGTLIAICHWVYLSLPLESAASIYQGSPACILRY